jgi:hypothetical protein
MWDIQTEVTPVIVGAAGTISKSLGQYPSNRPVKHVIKELQKTAIHIGHCTLTAESADVEIQNMFNMGSNITCRYGKL